MALTVIHHRPGVPMPLATDYETGTSVSRDRHGDIVVLDAEGNAIGGHAAAYFLDWTLTPAAPTGNDAEPATDAIDEPAAPLFVSFTTWPGKDDGAPDPRDGVLFLDRFREQSENHERTIANLISATPDAWGTYSGAELVRAYERGVADTVQDVEQATEEPTRGQGCCRS